MPLIVRASLLALLLALLGACAPTSAEVAIVATAAPPTPPTTTPPAPASPTLVEATPTPSPTLVVTLSPTSAMSTTADLLLSAQARDFCAPADPANCGAPLALLIADHLQRHPDDPQALALWRRVISLGAATPTASPGARIDVTWAFDGWAQAEFLALDLPSDLATPQPESLAVGALTITPTNLDGDATWDYLLSATISGGHPPTGQIRWMRWRDGAWAGEHLLTYMNDGGQIHVGDVTGDDQPDLLVVSQMCGSACSGGVDGWTWRDGAQASLFPRWADTSDITIHQDQGALAVTSKYADYTFDGQFLSPADLAVPTAPYSDRIASQMSYAHGLAVLGRFDQAIAVLESAATLPDGSAPYGHNTSLNDARPVALFRLGAIHLLNHEPAAARAAWAQVAQRYPKSAAAQVVQDLSLASFDGSLSEWCETLANQRANIMEGYQRNFLDQYPFNEFDWLPLCHPRVPLPLQSWTQAVPLAAQFAELGLPWQPLSEDYDLNGDGVSDPLGVVDWLGIYTPWAFLSADGGYRPLYAMQPWSIATPLATLTDPDYRLGRPGAASIIDLDADGAPEWLFDEQTSFYLVAWQGDRFHPNYISTYQGRGSFTATLTLAPQPDGTRRIVAELAPNAAIGQPDPSRIEYSLRDGRLRQIQPALVDLSGEYSFGKEYVSITMVYVALFGRNDPARALELLSARAPAADIWYQHQQLVAQALALEYGGQPDAARQLLDSVANAPQPTGWSLFARQRR